MADNHDHGGDGDGDGTPRRWGFQALVLASGPTAPERAALDGLLGALDADAALGAWGRPTSYRLVRRRDLEFDGGDRDVADMRPPPTPGALAMAFQRLVREDRAAFQQQTQPAQALAGAPAQSPPARVYLLIDYPSTVGEVEALLATGEETPPRRCQPGSAWPLLPLIDGVLLVTDVARGLRERRRSLTSPAPSDDPRRQSLGKRSGAHSEPEVIDRPLPPTASAFAEAGPFVRELYHRARAGGVEWADFLLVELPCGAVGDVVAGLFALVESLGARRAAFKNWVATVEIVPVPTMARPSAPALEELYARGLAGIYPPSISVAAVLVAAREAVVAVVAVGSHDDDNGDGSGDADGDGDNNRPHSPAPTTPEPFFDHGDEAAERMALAYSLFLGRLPGAVDGALDSPCCLGSERLDDLERAIWRNADLLGVGNCGRKGFPRAPQLAVADRHVQDAELATFLRPGGRRAAVAVAHARLVQQVLRAEELLGGVWRGRLRGRTHLTPLDRDVLPQRVARILRDDPVVLSAYDPDTDALVLALHVATAAGRFRTSAWSAREHVRHRPAFEDWAREPTDDLQTPRTAAAARAGVALSAGELAAVAERCSILYPADQSLVRLHQSLAGPSWLTITRDGDLVGLRPTPANSSSDAVAAEFATTFYANLADGTQLVAGAGPAHPRKPDGFGAVTLAATLPDGLLITACSDGVIVQRRLLVPVTAAVAGEAYRVVWGKGHVLSVAGDGRRVILAPNGDVRRVAPGDGPVAPAPAADASCPRERMVDPETNALVERRADGVVLVAYTDGARVAYHIDGTRIATNPARSHVLVTKPGFADVCIDVDVNVTASRHARGEPVAVTKGGLRTRSVVRGFDGTCLELQYNTRVVAEVNGRVVVESAGGATVVLKDSGLVEWRPRPEAQGPPRAPHEDDDRDVLSHPGTYYFDCRVGSFALCDAEENHFAVVGVGGPSARATVQLAGVLSATDAAAAGVEPIPARPVINDPIEPHVFILNGDGTGRELVRPRDLADESEAVHGSNVRLRAVHRPPRVRMWFGDAALTTAFARLEVPVATAARCLLRPVGPPPLLPIPEVVEIRRLEPIDPPMHAACVDLVTSAFEQWRRWGTAREANKNRFTVSDVRAADELTQEAALQRRVMAAAKATRARRRMERQRQRDLERKARRNSGGGKAPMATVAEGHEPVSTAAGGWADEDGGDEPHDHEGDPLGSESDGDVDDDSDKDMLEGDVDDPEALLWTAFSDADPAELGVLGLAQARSALVQALGFGVSAAEVTSILRQFQQREPFEISFDVFVDVAEALRQQQQQHEEDEDADNQSQDAARWGLPVTKLPGVASPRGSAFQAIRAMAPKMY